MAACGSGLSVSFIATPPPPAVLASSTSSNGTSGSGSSQRRSKNQRCSSDDELLAGLTCSCSVFVLFSTSHVLFASLLSVVSIVVSDPAPDPDPSLCLGLRICNYFLRICILSSTSKINKIKGMDRSFKLRSKSRLIRSVIINWRLGSFFYLILNGLHHKLSKKPSDAA